MKIKCKNCGYEIEDHLLDTKRWIEQLKSWRCLKCNVAMNTDLQEKMFEWCERNGAIKEIEDSYYENFLNFSDDGMKKIIGLILRDSLDSVNSIFLSENENDENIIKKKVEDLFKVRLNLLALGILGFMEKDGKLSISKPVGSYPPSTEIKKRLRERIEKATPLIWEVLEEVTEKQKGIKTSAGPGTITGGK